MTAALESELATETAPFVWALVRDHLGPAPSALPFLKESFPPYQAVNVEVGLNAYLSEPDTTSELIGLCFPYDTLTPNFLALTGLPGCERGPVEFERYDCGVDKVM